MPQPGHTPVTNREHAPATPESAPAESQPAPRTERLSLPSYRPPAERAPRKRILESAVANATPIDQQPMRDAAVASFGQKMILEVVIGNDDRVRLSSATMTANPWRQICALRIQSQSGQMYVGTGWYVAPRVLVTAGHCVYLHDDGGWAKSISVIPAKFGTDEPFKQLKATFFGSVDGWTQKRSSDFDYGAIFLDQKSAGPGAQVGNFEVQSLAPAALKGLKGQISGYPADRDSASFQYFHARPLIDVTATRLVYDIDTFGGQSGSPVWQESEEGGVVAVGIHTTGGTTSNSATRINDHVLDTMIQWVQENSDG